MKLLTYFDGKKYRKILEDGKKVIHIEIDKELGAAFVGFIDGKVDVIFSNQIELKEVPLVVSL